jgi:hypothetical protein
MNSTSARPSSMALVKSPWPLGGWPHSGPGAAWWRADPFPGLVASPVRHGMDLRSTRHKSVEVLRVYCRDAELFNGNAAAGLL